jgi:hypothetical protein
MPLMRAATAFILGCSLVWPACAQEIACQQRTIPISVGTVDGAPPPPIQPANIEGTYRNKPIHVMSISINKEPARILLLLDTSARMRSVTSPSGKNLSVELAEALAANMPPTSEIGLGTFDKELVPVLLPTTDRGELNQQLEGLNSHLPSFKGKTALWDALIGSVKMFNHPHLGDAIYLVTDGENDSFKTNKVESVTHVLGEADVRLFTFMLVDNPEYDLEEKFGWESVAEIVDATGGALVIEKGNFLRGFPITHHEAALVNRFGEPTQLALSLVPQYRQIVSFYRAVIDLPEPADKPRKWKLNLVGFSKPQQNNLTLTYPHMLVQCH